MTNGSGLGGLENHHKHHGRSQPYTERTIEWPTWGLIAVCYGGWLSLTYLSGAIPIWVFIPLAAYLVGLHSSIQHEVLHGHPTRNAAINEALVYLPLGLLVPYRRFKTLHLRHHCDERLTDPYDDPESWYVCPQRWKETEPLVRLVKRTNATLAGRLVFGPALSAFGLLRQDANLILSGDRTTGHAWLHHAVGLSLVLTWIIGVCGIGLWTYILCVAYPGMSLLLLRSYAEHRASDNPDHRSAIIETSPILSLLFLNNNLHFVHHQRPRVPWYALPALYRDHREEFQTRNGGYGFAGYGALLRAHFLRPHDDLLHPGTGRDAQK